MNNIEAPKSTGTEGASNKEFSVSELYKIAMEARLEQECIKLKYAARNVIANLSESEIDPELKATVLKDISEKFTFDAELLGKLTGETEQDKTEQMKEVLKEEALNFVSELSYLEGNVKVEVLNKVEEIFL